MMIKQLLPPNQPFSHLNLLMLGNKSDITDDIKAVIDITKVPTDNKAISANNENIRIVC